MANRIMDENDSDVARGKRAAAAASDVKRNCDGNHGAAQQDLQKEKNAINNNKSRRRVSRTSSMGGGVRRIIEKRFRKISHLMNDDDEVKTATHWAQKLQDHLQEKKKLGPSTHERQIRKRTFEPAFDGEGSIPDILAGSSSIPRDRGNYSSSARLEGRISPWLSPKKSLSSSRNNNSSHVNGSYSNLDDDNLHKHLKNNDKPPINRTRSNNNNDSKSIIFPPPPLAISNNNEKNSSSPVPQPQLDGSGGGGGGGSRSSFDGGDDFLNMSSGPLNTNSFSQMDLNESNEFKVLRQPPPQDTDYSPPSDKKTPIRKRSYTPPQSKKSIFGSSTTNTSSGGGAGKPLVVPKLSKQLTDFRLRRQGNKAVSSSGPNKGEEDGNFSVTTEQIPDATGGGQQKQGKNLHNLHHHPQDLTKEIELRREKFRDKLAGLYTKEDNATTTITKSTTTTTGLASAFAKNLQQTIDKNIKDLQEVDDVSMPSLTLDALLVTSPSSGGKGGRRPQRSLSASSAALRNKMDFGSGSLDSVALMATMFDDDDSLFFATATTGKNTKAKNSTTLHEPEEEQDDNNDAVVRGESLPLLPPTDNDAKAIKKSTTFPSKPAIISRSKTTSDLDKQHPLHQDTSMIIPSSATVTQSASISTNQEDVWWERNDRKPKRSGGSNKNSVSTVKSGRRDSIRSERATSGSGGSNHNKKKGDTSSFAFPGTNEPQQLLKTGKFKRRATVHVAADADLDLEQSFQIRDGEFVSGDSKFDSSFQNSNLDNNKDTASLFQQSFSALGSPTKSLSHSSKCTVNIIDTNKMPNLFEESNSALSAVKEALLPHDGNKRPKRRNSLPTGSSHGPNIPKTAMSSPTISKPKLTMSKSTSRDGGGAKTPPPQQQQRRRRRHSVQGPDLDQSFAQLGVKLDTADATTSPKSKSTASVASTTTSETKATGSVAGSTVVIGPEEEAQILAATKLMGLAPPPADAAAPPRRRTSIGVPSTAAADVQPPDKASTTVDKIRARRRESTRVSTRNEKTKLRMKDNSESAVSSRRRTERKSKRRTASVERSSDGRSTPSIREEPRKNHNGTLNRKGGDEMNDESRKKHSGRPNTPNAPRRTRRASMQLDSGGTGAQRTPRSKRKTASEGLYKPRSRGDSSPKPQISILSPSTPRMRALNRGVDDSSSQMGRSRSTMDDGSHMSRSGRRSSARPAAGLQANMDESGSNKSEEMSDDSDYEPTPKPAAPPTLPSLSTRKMVASSSGGADSSVLSGRRRRRSKSSSKSRRRRSEYTNKRDKEPDLPELVAPSSSAERRKTRNRRHAANEALKESGETSPLAGIVHKAAPTEMEAVDGIQSPEQDPSKAKKTVDKKLLLAELCRSPNKTNRFRRQKTTSAVEEVQQDDAVTKSPTGRSSRKSRRTKSDENKKSSEATKSPKTPNLRRRKTEVSGEVTPLSNRSRLRRVKTAGEGTLPSINLEIDIEDSAAEKKEAESRKGKGPEVDGNASNRFMLKGISF